jgi:hypothetical protein
LSGVYSENKMVERVCPIYTVLSVGSRSSYCSCIACDIWIALNLVGFLEPGHFINPIPKFGYPLRNFFPIVGRQWELVRSFRET